MGFFLSFVNNNKQLINYFVIEWQSDVDVISLYIGFYAVYFTWLHC